MVLKHLKRLFYSQLDGPDETKIGPLFKEKHSNPISSHSDSSQRFKPSRPYFLARHFGEKLIQMPSRQATALNIYITDGILTDLFGRYNKESGEYKNQVSNTRDILESFTNDIVQNPAIIDTIIFKNKNFLKDCHIADEIDAACQTLLSFIQFYFEEEWACDMKKTFQEQIALCLDSEDHNTIYEQLATILTWMLLIALLRNLFSKIKNLCPFTKQPNRHIDSFISHDKIRPVTLGLSKNKSTYVPRTFYLNQIKEQFQAEHTEKSLVVLSGIGGSGKSELARSYAWKERFSYRDILWLTCEDKSGSLELRSLLQKNYPNLDLKEFLKKLGQWTAQYLIIIDNCNIDCSDLFEELWYQTGMAHILITSRLSVFEDLSPESIILLDNLENTATDSTFLYAVFERNYTLENRAHIRKNISESERNNVMRICQLIGYNVMLTVMLAAQLREYDTEGISAFCSRLEQGLNDALPDGASINYKKDRTHFRDNIPSILNIIFQDLLNHTFTNFEKQVLSFLILAPAYQFRPEFLYQLLGDNSAQKYIQMTCNDLQDLGWIQHGDGWIAIHPLIAEMLEMNEEEILIKEEEKIAFYEHLIKNRLVMEHDWSSSYDDFIIADISTYITQELQLTLLSRYRHQDKIEIEQLFSQLYPGIFSALIVEVDDDYGRLFIIYDLDTRKEIMLLDLKDRKRNGRYFQMKSQHNPTFHTPKTHRTLNLRYAILPDDYELVLPDSICGCSTTEIPDRFLPYRNLKITFKTFPKHLKRIGKSAFFCGKIIGPLNLPDSLTYIGDNAFSSCSSLIGDLYLPNSVTHIGCYAFYHCNGFTGNLHLPDSITHIDSCAFYGCSGFTGNLHLPDSITHIDSCAFYGCSGFTGNLHLPDSITHIDSCAFSGCSGLIDNLHLPDSITHIGSCAFFGCSGLTGNLHLPDSITHIGSCTFSGCSGLTGNLHLPDSITHIDGYAFSGCSGFTGNLHLPDSITHIGSFAFSGCSGLTGSITLPENVYIGIGAFDGTNITINRTKTS